MANVIANLFAKLQLDISDFSSKLNTASSRMSNFAVRANRMYGQVINTQALKDSAKELADSYREATKDLRTHNISLKDTVRIMQGIVVAQTFYRITNTIQDATASLWEFNKQLDYAQVTYTALFGDPTLATDFLQALKQHAVETIFDYQNLADASKKLLAYGIDYKNLMFIMEGLTNLGAMSGDAAALDRIALALGQIYTRGKLSAEEMRQLANAYVPITDIIQEKFNLTPDQLGRVGDLNLPAHDVINAAIDYANEQFGAVGDAAMYTITGLENKIVDTLKVLGVAMIEPIGVAYKSFLEYIAGGLAKIRDEFDSGGLGGVFEYLVPDKQTQQIIRQFLANVRNLFMSLASVGVVMSQVFGNFAHAFVTAFNIVTPVVVTVVNALAALLSAMLSTRTGATILRTALIAAAGAFVIFKIHAISALVVTLVTKAVHALSRALLVLAVTVVKHPILMLFAGLAVALIGVAATSDKANGAISKLFNTLSGAGSGATSNDILQKTDKDIKDIDESAEKFNERLKESADSAGDLANGIGAAGKEAKKTRGLLSFDEVFKLNEPSASSTGAGSGINDSISDIIDGLGGLGNALIPDIPDFSDFIDGFTSNLFGGLLDKVKQIASGGLTGALIGGLAGFAIGGLVTRTLAGALAGANLGAKLGAAAGAGFAAFWGDTYAEVEKTLSAIANGGAIGILVGGLAGFIIGAFATKNLKAAITAAQLGAGIGGIIGASVAGIFSNASVELDNAIKKIAIGSAEGALLGGLAGMIIGAFATRTLQGALTGAKLGAKLGTLIGGTVGAIFGDAEASVGDALSNLFSSVEAAAMGSFIGGLAGMIIGAIVGALAGGVGALPGAKVGAMLGSTLGSLGGLLVSYLDNSGITEAMSDWLDGVWESIAGFFGDLGGTIATWCVDTWGSIKQWSSDTLNDFGEWVASSYNSFMTWNADTAESIRNWSTDTYNKIDSWANNTAASIVSWVGNTFHDIDKWCDDTIAKYLEWDGITWSTISEWADNTWSTIATWSSDALSTVSTWCTDAVSSFNTWKSNVGTTISTWATEVSNTIVGWVNTVDGKIGEFFDLDMSFSDFCKSTLKSITDWASGIWNGVKEYFGNAIDKVKEFLNINDKASNAKPANVPSQLYQSSMFSPNLIGHATGGVFDREHIARLNEGNKREAVIPLENNTAMQPFVDAVSSGIVASLVPMVAQINSNNSGMPPMYVGTLVADERGLKQLYKKFELIRAQEDARTGKPAEVL